MHTVNELRCSDGRELVCLEQGIIVDVNVQPTHLSEVLSAAYASSDSQEHQVEQSIEVHKQRDVFHSYSRTQKVCVEP